MFAESQLPLEKTVCICMQCTHVYMRAMCTCVRVCNVHICVRACNMHICVCACNVHICVRAMCTYVCQVTICVFAIVESRKNSNKTIEFLLFVVGSHHTVKIYVSIVMGIMFRILH